MPLLQFYGRMGPGAMNQRRKTGLRSCADRGPGPSDCGRIHCCSGRSFAGVCGCWAGPVVSSRPCPPPVVRNPRPTACAPASTTVNSRLTCTSEPVLRKNQGGNMPATRPRSTPSMPQERARRPVNGKTGPEVAPVAFGTKKPARLEIEARRRCRRNDLRNHVVVQCR